MSKRHKNPFEGVPRDKFGTIWSLKRMTTLKRKTPLITKKSMSL